MTVALLVLMNLKQSSANTEADEMIFQSLLLSHTLHQWGQCYGTMPSSGAHRMMKNNETLEKHNNNESRSGENA